MEYVKLSRLKYLQLQTEQIFEPIFETVGVIGVMDSLFCEYTDAMNIGVFRLYGLLIIISYAVSIKHGLRTTDSDYGLGIKHGLGIKRGLSITDWV